MVEVEDEKTGIAGVHVVRKGKVHKQLIGEIAPLIHSNATR
jgi:hypothetical protein